jgi:transposase
MSEVKTRKVHTPEFKAKVGLEALRGVKTINEIERKGWDTSAIVGSYRDHPDRKEPSPCDEL